MITLSDLHTYWKEKLNIILSQEDDTLQHGQLMVWLSFQLPLALDTQAPFYNHFGAYWCTAVHDILENRFRNIMNTPPETDVDTCYNINDMCTMALQNAGAKIFSKPSHLEKNKDKIEAYNQQKTALTQFTNSFHNPFIFLIPDDWTYSFKGVESFGPFLHNNSRTPEVIDKAQELLKMGGFGALTVEGSVDNNALLGAMEHISTTLQLCAPSQLPTTVAGLDGCNLCFTGRAYTNLAAFYPLSNSISFRVDNEEAATFWHEWMHMLEERVEYSASLQDCPNALVKYKNLQAAVADINKSVGTLPKDSFVSELYFADPYHLVTQCVQQLCDMNWFTDEANRALLGELQTNVSHRTYNLESFKCLLRTAESAEQRDNALTDLCNQWRNETLKKHLRYGALSCASFYDSTAQRLVAFHKHLKTHSNFVSAAKGYDHNRDKAYWSTPHELLARSFESFVNTQWMKTNEFSEYYPQGQELDHVVTGFERFMQNFKAVWSNQNTQKAEPMSASRIANKRSVVNPVKKRLTRF